MKNKLSFWAKVLPLVILIAATLNTALNCDDGGVVLSPARLEIAPAELDFGENDNSLAFAVKNTGQQNLTWTVFESVDWISDFQNTTGKITGTGESQITVTIDRDRLSPGDNTGSIQVTAAADDGSALEGGAKNVTVKAHKPSPPEVSMSDNDISGIGSADAVARGLIDNIGSGNITQHGHVWNTSPNPDLSDGSLSKTTLGVKTETGTFTSPLANLNPNATYYIRAYAINSAGITYSNEVTFSTADNNASTNIVLSNAAIQENQASNTVIGVLSTSDPDAGDTHTYSLVSGTGSTDNNSFNINSNQLRSSNIFDFETKNSYSIRVRSTNLGTNDAIEQAFTISVTDLNEAPTNITLSNSTIAENQPSNTIVGTLTSSDPDAGDTHTYNLVSGTGSTDNSNFNISGTSLRSSAVFDFEAKNSYSIRIRSTDGNGENYEKSFTITITDVLNIIENIAKVTVSGGTFERGCKSGRDDINGHSCDSDESPLHTVTVSSFKLSQYEITNAEYAAFLNDLGGVSSSGSYADPDFGTVTYADIDDSDCMLYYSGGTFLVESGLDNYPMIEVSWYGANAFAKWAGGRLPTEAEWEFAARGGTSSQNYQFSGSNTVGNVAWYSDNIISTGQSNFDGVQTHPVGTKAPNELGLYDMSGNVWEWCQDWYASYSSTAQTNPMGPSSGSNRLVRGGSWSNNAPVSRVADRSNAPPSDTYFNTGFWVFFH